MKQIAFEELKALIFEASKWSNIHCVQSIRLWSSKPFIVISMWVDGGLIVNTKFMVALSSIFDCNVEVQYEYTGEHYDEPGCTCSITINDLSDWEIAE